MIGHPKIHLCNLSLGRRTQEHIPNKYLDGSLNRTGLSRSIEVGRESGNDKYEYMIV